MTRAARWLVACSVLALAACDGPDVIVDPPLVLVSDAELRQAIAQWGTVPIGPTPTVDPKLVALGQALFFDKILSGNRDIACATCHHPSTHGADALSLAIGTGGTGLGPSRVLGPMRAFVPRNSPSLLNQGLRSYFLFWDGRLEGFGSGPFAVWDSVPVGPGFPNILAAQAMLPVLNRREMRGELSDVDGYGNELAQLDDRDFQGVWRAVMARLLAIPGYRQLLQDAFPGVPEGSLHFRHAATAMAAFITAKFTRAHSPFDRYLAGDDDALTSAEKRGALLFFAGKRTAPVGAADIAPFPIGNSCASCHNGPLLGGQTFANVGTPQLGPGVGTGAPLDRGRAELFGNQGFYEFAFRAPPLRNVELTAPYMHNGAYATLEAVVEHYSDVREALRSYDVTQLAPALRALHHGDGGTIEAVLGNLDHRLRTPFDFSDQEQSDLVAFLKSLTDPAARDLGALVPASVPSGLPVER